jgi:hypothetical protein
MTPRLLAGHFARQCAPLRYAIPNNIEIRALSPRGQRAQALVEFALVLPVFMLFVFVTIQLSLLFVAYYSETEMARDTARWLAVNASSTDLEVAQHVQSTMLPGLVNGIPGTSTWDSTNPQDIFVSYPVGKMTVRFTPCDSTAGGTPPCSHPNRGPGATLYVDMSYDIRNLLFLPSKFGFGKLSVGIPTTLPAYRVHIMVE